MYYGYQDDAASLGHSLEESSSAPSPPRAYTDKGGEGCSRQLGLRSHPPIRDEETEHQVQSITDLEVQ